LAEVTTIDAANSFLMGYMKEYNAQFAEEPEDSEKAYRELSPAVNLDNILCNMERRTFDHGGIFSFYNRTFKIVSDKPDRLLPQKGNIQVLFSPVFGVRACFAGIVYDVVPFTKPEKAQKKASSKPRTKYIPEDSHYYKYGHKLIKKVTFEDSDIAILKMLERVFLWKMPA
jgi:hypothetical protein